MPIDHLGINVSDPEKSKLFYTQALGPLGYKVMVEVPKEFTGGKVVMGLGVAPNADFWLTGGKPNDQPVHVAFSADTRAKVDECYKLALANGGKDNGPPGLRAHYHRDYYGAFVFDPDGNNIEVVCHKAPSTS